MSDEKIKVAVSMITYNHEAFVWEAIKSVINQKTDFAFKLFITDDKSPDNTGEICRKIASDNQDIVNYEFLEKNIGVRGNFIYNLTKCLKSGADYIAICEGDDYWIDENKLQKQVDFLENNKEYNICCSSYKIVYEDTKVGEYKYKSLSYHQNFSFTINDMKTDWLTKTLTSVFRAELILNLNMDVYKHFRDIHLFYHVVRNGKGYFMNDQLGAYRVHQGGVCSLQSEQTNKNISYKIYKELHKINQDSFTRYKRFVHTLAWLNFILYNKSEYKKTQVVLKLIAESVKQIRSLENLSRFIITFFPIKFRQSIKSDKTN